MIRPRPPLPIRLARRYRAKKFKGYALGKLMTDPVYRAVHERVGQSTLPLLDIGCGPGLCAFYLLDHGYRGPILGIDPDTDKITAARDAASRGHLRTSAPLRFEVGDGAAPRLFDDESEHAFAGPGHVVMLDVLHYFDPPTQRLLLERMIAATAPGAWTILRDSPRDHSWRCRMTLAEEWAIGKIGWIKTPPTHFPTAGEITAPFVQAGFDTDVTPLWGKTPLNSYLFAFRRPEAKSPHSPDSGRCCTPETAVKPGLP